MAGKSATYTHASQSNGEGLLLLCEVALGDSLELPQGKFLTKDDLVRQGKHSTKGLGKEEPDVEEGHWVGGRQVRVPLGRMKKLPKAGECELDHNEFIIYEQTQATIKYLVRLRVREGPLFGVNK
eukprot:TRINITY_DN808_c0_g1_i5.p1 TRINITY_DN808_c0_g1~~TRINITY_DN808_c0_g1_i5.p1  ORF type:complete len:125 (+),score=32.31 TRINITY_DN808_c0_g1_i5:104-478(+)